MQVSQPTPPPSAAGDTQFAPGSVIGTRFDVEALRARALFGELYRCKDRASGRIVALRFLSTELFPEHSLDRLCDQVGNAVGLTHRNIASTFGLGRQGDTCYVVSEFVEGRTLREILDSKSRDGRVLGVKGALNVAMHLTAALKHAKQVHGGITPSSVMVDRAGRVKLMDFGLAASLSARPTSPDSLEAVCVAPELDEQNGNLGGRCDVYSLGAILYMALTGVPPDRPAPSLSALVDNVSRELEAIVQRALSLDPAARYADCVELRNALKPILRTLSGAQPSRKAATVAPSGHATPSPQAAPPAGQPQVSAAPSQVVSAPAQGGIDGGPTTMAPPPVRNMTPAPGSPKVQGKTPFTPPPVPPPQAVAPGAAPQRVTPVPPEREAGRFAVDSLLGSADDGAERWLVQKDRLDFGPFSLEDLRRQLHEDQFSEDNFIVDQGTGERSRIGDHPLLKSFMEELKRERDRKRRQAADQQQAKGEQRSRNMFRLVVAGAVLGVAGIGGLYIWKRPKIEERVIVKERDADLEGLLSNISIDWKPRERGTTRRARKGGGRAQGSTSAGTDPFDSPMVLGDATTNGGDEQLDQFTIQNTMQKNFGKLKRCVLEEKRRNRSLRNVDMDFIVRGSGSVSNVRVNGQQGGPFHQCMLSKMKSISFPMYNGDRTVAGFSMSLK